MRNLSHLFAIAASLLVLTFASPSLSRAADGNLHLRISAGDTDRAAGPLSTVVVLPADWGTDIVAEAELADGTPVPAQVAGLSLFDKPIDTDDGLTAHRLWLAAPAIAAGETLDVTVTKVEPGTREETDAFHWQDEPGQDNDLYFGDRPVMRYHYAAYEDDDAQRDVNNKPFHHLFDSTGEMLVTNGEGAKNYFHHKGLFYGFTRITRDGETSNLWYCHDGERQTHDEVLEETAGPVLGRHRVRITWRNRQGEPLCDEIREMTAFHTDGGTLVQFASKLSSAGGTLTLDGDPQHAGFQFRAADEVADREKENTTYYLRVDGKGQPGETRNAPEDERMKNLPWNAMSFVLGDRRFTAVYIDHPQNPKPSFYSERTYGRFGSWFGPQTLEENGDPVAITYRIWLQDGEMSVDDAEKLSANFASPAKVEMVQK